MTMELKDWTILSDSPSVGLVIPEEPEYTYDLFNITDSEAVVYGERRWGINLKWGDPTKSNNVRFRRESGSTEAIKFEEPIAINIRGGGYLVYQPDRWGINLGWSNTPKYEWLILGDTAGNQVPVGKAVGLYSLVEKDSIAYEGRDWGINLKWFKDAGKWTKLRKLWEAGEIVRDVYNYF